MRAGRGAGGGGAPLGAHGLELAKVGCKGCGWEKGPWLGERSDEEVEEEHTEGTRRDPENHRVWHHHTESQHSRDLPDTRRVSSTAPCPTGGSHKM
eukprot:2578363-Rhodomonas_salina.3